MFSKTDYHQREKTVHGAESNPTVTFLPAIYYFLIFGFSPMRSTITIQMFLITACERLTGILPEKKHNVFIIYPDTLLLSNWARKIYVSSSKQKINMNHIKNFGEISRLFEKMKSYFLTFFLFFFSFYLLWGVPMNRQSASLAFFRTRLNSYVHICTFIQIIKTRDALTEIFTSVRQKNIFRMKFFP